jgi:hypothetical protein
MRPAPDKDPLVVLDHVGNTRRHGRPDFEQTWTLDGIDKPKGGAPIRICPECDAAKTLAVASPQGLEPKVTPELEAGDDRDWFADHPNRRFRARRGNRSVIIVRKAGDVLLRTVAPADTPIVDDDHNLAFSRGSVRATRIGTRKGSAKRRAKRLNGGPRNDGAHDRQLYRRSAGHSN